MTMELSDRLTAAILLARGATDGEAWLRALPRRVDTYLRRWGLAPLAVAEGGAMSYCLFCTTGTGTAAVLKIPFDAATGRLEARSLARWARAGASPDILATAPSSGVFLMSRVQPGTTAVPTGLESDTKRLCDLITRMTRPDLGPMRALTTLEALTRIRFEWLLEWSVRPGYDEQLRQLPLAAALLARLTASAGPPQIIHGDLQPKNILLGRGGIWQAIDPLTCRGELNAEAALWAVAHPDSATIEQRIHELARCSLLDVSRLRAWCFIYAVAEYRAHLPALASRIRNFTAELDWQGAPRWQLD